MPNETDHNENVASLYEELGIRREVLEFGRRMEERLKERFVSLIPDQRL